jgi:hypothetical protein
VPYANDQSLVAAEEMDLNRHQSFLVLTGCG